MVVLQVTDQVGRTNQCMVTVEVQDKRIPTLTCPADVVVECTTPFDVNDLSASLVTQLWVAADALMLMMWMKMLLIKSTIAG